MIPGSRPNYIIIICTILKTREKHEKMHVADIFAYPAPGSTLSLTKSVQNSQKWLIKQGVINIEPYY